VAPNIIIQAAAEAAATGIRPEQALLASGLLTEENYYCALARHLGLPYVEEPALLGSFADFPNSILSGAAPLARNQDGAPAWLMSPTGARLDDLLRLRCRGALPRSRFAIAPPRALARMVMEARGAEIAEGANRDLARRHGEQVSAQHWSGQRVAPAIALSAAALVGLWSLGGLAWLTLSLAMSMLLAGFISLRLFAAAASCETDPVPVPLGDADLPVYSVVVGLYREAAVVPQLVAALDRLDYSKGKLDILLAVEASDHETRLALERLRLPARYRVVVVPEGQPRTKPRALNVALPLARGRYLCIFDAEDIPEPGQLREAAECFEGLPDRIACLQGRLVIDNGEDGWLARCFAIEYAALFDLINPGLSALRLPVPLGGASNHFRTDILRQIGGWDAWNVTEDIDLGLRLARFGYDTGALDASTYEEAPAELRRWMNQRRRWFKGWIQTLLVHGAHPMDSIRRIGVAPTAAALLIVAGTLTGALLGPFFAALALWDPFHGDFLAQATPAQLVISTLWCFVGLSGLASAFWPVLLGMKRRSLWRYWPLLPLLPVYWTLMTVAAWWAVLDFMRNPFNWLKMEHGLARNRRSPLPG
jgi:cellulose synthase/poly-beta-1,6-N-acetylglucosamine synthase-like glycosyltransferase